MSEFTSVVNWLGTLSGIWGVVLALYLQLVNPRRCHPAHITALFVSGAALVLTFSAAWSSTSGPVEAYRTAAVVMFVTLESVAGYYIWKASEVAPSREVIMNLFTDDRGRGET